MPLIPDDRIDEVRAACDLVDVISRYVPLKRSGSGFKARCPFHEEKTGSFHVWPHTQTWKCFGCGKGGSVFHFVMERERLTFPEAVRSLAREVGIDLGPETEEQDAGAGERAALFDLMEWASRFFQARLRAPEGAKVVEYLKSRGLTGETAHRFQLGYAPDGWRALLTAAREKGVPEDRLERAGLIRPGKAEPYDWFRDRLMFPIHDVRGRVVGFGGRALDDSEPKYLNSPDTMLFKKGRTLYALDKAREVSLKGRRLGIMEGYTDVLMAHQHGIEWVVAGLGTGLTPEHAALARRYADRIDLIYDADEAGAKAAERALQAFLAVDAEVRVVQLPGGLDPCDFLVEQGPEAFLERIDKGKEVFDFLIGRAGGRHDLSTVAGRVAAVDEILRSVVTVDNPVKRDLLVSRVAEGFGVSESSVRERMKVFTRRHGAVETGPAPAPPADEPAERLMVEAVLQEPALVGRMAEEWPPERLRHPALRVIAETACALFEQSGELDPAALAGRLADPAAARELASLLTEGGGKAELVRQYEQCVSRLDRERRVNETKAARDAARAEGNIAEADRLTRELFEIQGRKR